MSNPTSATVYASPSGRTLVYVPAGNGEYKLVYGDGTAFREASVIGNQKITTPGEYVRFTVPDTELGERGIFRKDDALEFDRELFRQTGEHNFQGDYVSLPNVVPGSVFLARDTATGITYFAIYDQVSSKYCLFALTGDPDSAEGATGVREDAQVLAGAGFKAQNFELYGVRVELSVYSNPMGPDMPSTVGGRMAPKLDPDNYNFTFEIVGDPQGNDPHWMTARVTPKA